MLTFFRTRKEKRENRRREIIVGEKYEEGDLIESTGKSRDYSKNIKITRHNFYIACPLSCVRDLHLQEYKNIRLRSGTKWIARDLPRDF